jgi:N utilization substance protein B
MEQAVDRAGGKAGNKGADAALGDRNGESAATLGLARESVSQVHRARSLARRLGAAGAVSTADQSERPGRIPTSNSRRTRRRSASIAIISSELIAAIAPNREALDARLAQNSARFRRGARSHRACRAVAGLHELARPELPYRVALAEAVQLTKQFGATDGHKFVNAVLDRPRRNAGRYGQPRE